MTTDDPQPLDRVVWVGTGREGHLRKEPEREWRRRLAHEMNEACDEMALRGLRLANIVPVHSSGELRGGWTEGAWLHFARPNE